MRKKSKYPLPRPKFTKDSEYRMPCPRLILGLRYYTDERGDINRHIWNEMQVSISYVGKVQIDVELQVFQLTASIIAVSS